MHLLEFKYLQKNHLKNLWLKIDFFMYFRAQAVKRKLEAQREEKRRQSILNRRREEQREATEKFQRSHVSSRPSSKTSNSSSGNNSFNMNHNCKEDR